MNIGYWGIPGSERVTIVHVQTLGQETLCGRTMSDKFEFQWCARMDRLFVHRYIECKTCKKRIIRIMEKELEETKARMAAKETKKKRNRATAARDTKEAAVCADLYMNMTRCIGGHVIVEGLMCPHCGSYDPPSECRKEKIDLNKEKK